jgi:hypothetical protein
MSNVTIDCFTGASFPNPAMPVQRFLGAYSIAHFGLRRQSEATTALSYAQPRFTLTSVTLRPKAAWRFTSRRSP